LRIIDEILTLLKDGNWHNRSELAKKYSSNGLKVKIVISFLSKFDFIELDKKVSRNGDGYLNRTVSWLSMMRLKPYQINSRR